MRAVDTTYPGEGIRQSSRGRQAALVSSAPRGAFPSEVLLGSGPDSDSSAIEHGSCEAERGVVPRADESAVGGADAEGVPVS